MPDETTTIDEAPLFGEVFVVFADGGHVRWTGPDGPAPWRVDLAPGCDPVSVVRDAVTRVLGEPRLLHSTSWRSEAGTVVLTFLAVLEREQVRDRDSCAVERVELARGDAVEPPPAVDERQVIEHAMRHLAWLLHDDDSVAATLSDAWREALAAYPAEPFRAMRAAP